MNRRLFSFLNAAVAAMFLIGIVVPMAADSKRDAQEKAQIAKAKAEFARGQKLMAAEKYVDAEAAFRKVLAITPNDTTALQALGGALEKEGKSDEASAIYEKVTKMLLDPASAPPNVVVLPTTMPSSEKSPATTQPAAAPPEN